MIVGVVDYGMGNLLSVMSAVEYIGYDVKLCNKANDLKTADKIILPGVGSFKNCSISLKESGFWEALNIEVLENKKYILGICLGMQVMAKKGFEDGNNDGLGWFDAEVIKISSTGNNLKVPQIGWNNIEYDERNPLFKNILPNSEYYFVHSYYMKCFNIKNVIATCDYGTAITAAVNKENIFATQFHPEKSQDHGIKILDNFLSL